MNYLDVEYRLSVVSEFLKCIVHRKWLNEHPSFVFQDTRVDPTSLWSASVQKGNLHGKRAHRLVILRKFRSPIHLIFPLSLSLQSLSLCISLKYNQPTSRRRNTLFLKTLSQLILSSLFFTESPSLIYLLETFLLNRKQSF